MPDHLTPPDLRSQMQALASRISELEKRSSRGDSWHEVGAPGEPAFQGGWSNIGGTSRTAAFKLLSPALFAMKGSVLGGTSGTAVFTVPNWTYGYTVLAFALLDGGAQLPCSGVIDASGNVIPFAGGGSGALDLVGLNVLVAL